MLRRRLGAQLEKLGAEIALAEDLRAARKLLAAGGFDFALLDVNLPDGQGTELLKERAFSPDTGVVILTAHGGVGGAVEAMRLGALDYLLKPFEAEQLALVIERARNLRQSARAERHRREGDPADDFFFSPSLAGLQEQLKRILAVDERTQGPLPPVLIQGETGTGKTAVARWLHRHGPRGGKELIEVNCSALPESLAESELFGHEAGAFTDARRARMGLFEAASGGTLLLDELPSLSMPIQAKVLTAIEDHKIRRVGATHTLPVDVRLVAATNRDLRDSPPRAAFARTSSIAWTSSASSCRRCASEAGTSSSWPRSSCSGSAKSTARAPGASPRSDRTVSSSLPGRETCANWPTSWSGPSSLRTRRNFSSLTWSPAIRAAEKASNPPGSTRPFAFPSTVSRWTMPSIAWSTWL